MKHYEIILFKFFISEYVKSLFQQFFSSLHTVLLFYKISTSKNFSISGCTWIKFSIPLYLILLFYLTSGFCKTWIIFSIQYLDIHGLISSLLYNGFCERSRTRKRNSTDSINSRARYRLFILTSDSHVVAHTCCRYRCCTLFFINSVRTDIDRVCNWGERKEGGDEYASVHSVLISWTADFVNVFDAN